MIYYRVALIELWIMVNMPKSKVLSDVVAQSWSEQVSGHFSCEVALSGGLDSVVLLHVLCALRNRLSLTVSAVHVHHGLQSDADKWAEFCHILCRQWQVPLRVARVNISASPLGTEGAARAARYDVFSGSLQSLLALAHHADDQNETFFLALLRGGGVRGMASMPAVRTLPSGQLLWRPLLNIDRQTLAEYAAEHQLDYVQDPSNQDQQYLRNWLRNNILPKINTRLPELSAHIQHNISSCQQILQLAQMMTDMDWQTTCTDDYLSVPAWQRLPEVRRHALLYHFAKVHDLGVPRSVSIEDFAHQLFTKPQSPHTWFLPQGQAYLYDNRLWPWADSGSLKQLCVRKEAWQYAQICWQSNSFGLPEKIIPLLSVRRVLPKDILTMRYGRKSVLKLLQEHKIPHFIRRDWPVLVDANGQCLAVVGVRVCADVAIANGLMPNYSVLQAYLSDNIIQ